jgi:hypothetical protein
LARVSTIAIAATGSAEAGLVEAVVAVLGGLNPVSAGDWTVTSGVREQPVRAGRQPRAVA